MPATAPEKNDSRARLPIPLMVTLPAAALLVACLYELLGRGAALAEAKDTRSRLSKATRDCPPASLI